MQQMTDKEKRIVTTITEAFPQLTEFEKGYLLGLAEGKIKNKPPDKEETPVV